MRILPTTPCLPTCLPTYLAEHGVGPSLGVIVAPPSLPTPLPPRVAQLNEAHRDVVFALQHFRLQQRVAVVRLKSKFSRVSAPPPPPQAGRHAGRQAGRDTHTKRRDVSAGRKGRERRKQGRTERWLMMLLTFLLFFLFLLPATFGHGFARWHPRSNTRERKQNRFDDYLVTNNTHPCKCVCVRVTLGECLHGHAARRGTPTRRHAHTPTRTHARGLFHHAIDGCVVNAVDAAKLGE